MKKIDNIFTDLIVKWSIIDDRVTGEFLFILFYFAHRVLLRDDEKLKKFVLIMHRHD
jgi:hypothetical protein